jgi:hypothetical protein
MNPGVILKMVKLIACLKPRVIGVDILTELDVYPKLASKLKASNTKALNIKASNLDKAPTFGAKTVWIAGAENIEMTGAEFGWFVGKEDELMVRPGHVFGQTPEIGKPLFVDNMPPVDNSLWWGVSVAPKEYDRAMRRIPRQVLVAPSISDEIHMPSWGRLVAEEYCHSGTGSRECRLDEGRDKEQIFISYGVRPPRRFPRALDIFQCGANDVVTPNKRLWNEFRSIAANSPLILLGGTFRDKAHSATVNIDTPLGPLPGLLINAYAIETEIEGAGLHEVWPIFGFLADCAVGFVLALPFMEKRYGVRGLIRIDVMWLALTIVISVFLLWHRWLWVSFPGVALGVLLHQTIERYIESKPPGNRKT